MSYSFPADIARLVQAQIARGVYTNDDDVLRDALEALETQLNSAINEEAIVVEGVRRGIEDMKAGRSKSLEAFDAEFRAKHNIPRDA